MSTIKKYCITNGTVNRVQQNLYEGGSIPGRADISYAVREADDIMRRGNAGDYHVFGFSGSYTGMFYDALYCFGKTMFQNANGREIPCSQRLLCAWEDLTDGNLFMDEVLRFSYLSLDELLASADYTKQQIFERAPRSIGEGVAFDDVQKKSIARAVYQLMMEKNVVLLLPSVPNYEEYSLAVLQEVFRNLPKADRREITFSTARTSSDIVRLKGRIRLVLSVEGQSKVGDAEWIRLNEDIPLSEEETVIYRWQQEAKENRDDVEQRSFTFEQEEQHRSLKKDYGVLSKLYSSASNWWNRPDSQKRFMTFKEVLTEYSGNPTAAIRDNRKAFFGKLSQLLDPACGDEDTPEKNLISVLIDYLYESKGKTSRLYENKNALDSFLKRCEEEYHWFGMSEAWVKTFLEEIKLLQEILNRGLTA